MALIKGQLEQAHAEGYERVPQAGETVSTVDARIWPDLPWDDG